MEQAFQIIASGLSNGAIYAFVAIGLVVIYNVTGIVNLAQGEFLMLGAMITIALAGPSGSAGRLPLVLAVPIAVLAVAAIGGVVERVALVRRSRLNGLTLLMITLGVGIAIRGAALLGAGPTTYGLRPFTAGSPIDILGVRLPRQSIWVIGGLALAMIALWFLFEKNLVGLGMRACEVNPRAAELMGINPKRYGTLAWILSAGLAGLGGALIAPVAFGYYEMGLLLGLKGFAAWVLGGIKSPVGATIGGLLLGVIEAMANGYLPNGIKSYAEAIPFVVIVAAMLSRPGGIIRPALSRAV